MKTVNFVAKQLVEVIVFSILCLFCATLYRGYRIVAIAETVAENHLVEKGNGAAWPVKFTGLLGEISKTSDSVRVSADTVKTLLEKDAPQTAASLRGTANQINLLLQREGPGTAASVRDAAAGLAGTSRTVQSLLTNDGPETAKSVRDAAAEIAGVAGTVHKLVDEDGPPTAKSIRDAANTVQQLAATEGPATAASVRKATDSGAEIAGAWAAISDDLKTWIDRMTAPPTVKQKVWAVLHALIIALAHSI